MTLACSARPLQSETGEEASGALLSIEQENVPARSPSTFFNQHAYGDSELQGKGNKSGVIIAAPGGPCRMFINQPGLNQITQALHVFEIGWSIHGKKEKLACCDSGWRSAIPNPS